MSNNETPPRETANDANLSEDGVRRIDVKDIFDGAREAILIHSGEQYRLRITANGKLILTK